MAELLLVQLVELAISGKRGLYVCPRSRRDGFRDIERELIALEIPPKYARIKRDQCLVEFQSGGSIYLFPYVFLDAHPERLQGQRFDGSNLSAHPFIAPLIRDKERRSPERAPSVATPPQAGGEPGSTQT